MLRNGILIYFTLGDSLFKKDDNTQISKAEQMIKSSDQ